ncbi:M23 family metallopeptidase [Streptomyces sp. MI02-7b]|uniref:murein hydrolase activator EnvC family protein n=1 Tax=Streptomyces sp. MI02-7b TaxID=462941 RepID=UPI0029CA9A8D|nr:M23 family metallopeptidase [Streptomyces sp. MI02-7b]
MTRSTVFVVTVYLAVTTWLGGLTGPVSAVVREGDRGDQADRGGVPADRAWPVAAADGARRPVVERGFDPPPVRWAAGHRGVDLRAGPGAPVRAAAPGRVAYAGSVAGRGIVVIRLAEGLRITYQPVRATVAVGEEVRAGQVVGVLADGPWHCPGGCLHWGLLRGEFYLDPLSLLPDAMLRGGPSRLLPVFGVPLPEGTEGGRMPEGTAAPAVSRGPRAGPW